MSENQFAFDQWANPSFGYHYVVDIHEGKLVAMIALGDPKVFTPESKQEKAPSEDQIRE